jgi:hypothetical protein
MRPHGEDDVDTVSEIAELQCGACGGWSDCQPSRELPASPVGKMTNAPRYIDGAGRTENLRRGPFPPSEDPKYPGLRSKREPGAEIAAPINQASGLNTKLLSSSTCGLEAMAGASSPVFFLQPSTGPPHLTPH